MKAVFINSKDRTVTDVEVSEKDTLHDWYKILGVEMVETACYINKHEDAILVDEEGLLKLTQDTPFFQYKDAHQPFAGNGLVVGVNEDGDSISPHVTADDIRPLVTFHTLAEVSSGL